ncbi:MAG: hypothetical protein IJC13_00725 [Clostridia bacterium]|nr:hypothetical protein [Clostridia bacterium]
MVLDTRWKNFKYSWFTKLVCILLACVCAVSCVLSFMPLFYRFIITNGNLKVDEKVTVYDTTSFVNYVRQDISRIIELSQRNQNIARFEAEKKKCVDSIVAQFVKEQEIWKANGGKIEYYYEDDYEGFTQIEYYSGKNFSYRGDYSDTSVWLDFSHDVKQITSQVEGDFTANFYNSFVGRVDEQSLEELRNVRYYAVASDGTVISNVDSKESVVNEAFSEYIFVENGKTTYSENIGKSAFPEVVPSHYFTTSTNVYYSINPSFTGNDKFFALNNMINTTNSLDYTALVAKLIASFVGVVLFLCLSVSLAGHKSGELSLAFIDKIPCDLHLALSVFADFWVGFAAVGLAYLRHEQILWDYEADFFVEEIVAHSELFMIVISAVVAVFVLILAELLTSFARRIKTKSPIFRYTLIFFIIAAAFKLLKLVVRGVVSFLRKVKKAVKKWFKTIIFKPQKLNKGVAKLVTVFVAVNIIGFGICCWCAFMSGWYNEAAWSVVALIVLAVGLLFDAYSLYRLFKYMRALDTIIDKADKHEPFDMNPNEIPESLMPLVRAYDETNSELQKAVIKAVKDERTKTELITNVSHDLKTPLTSVINYIDLLKQCDISDEKALEYMGVIDEKSIKLKRLIEDLIEASKVSSGNVAINKTKLNLNELATQAIVEENSELEKHGLSLIFNEPEQKVIVTADGTKIYRVIENLLSNVCKYSAPHSRVYASVYSQGGYGYFEIKNISSEPLNISAEELTERFVRGDASRNRDGNGLGLSIAKDLCALNDGELIISIDGDLFKATVKLPR